MLAVGPTGLASADPKGLTEALLQCLDDFLDIISAPGTDLTRPSRLKGWSGADTCIHMGQWAANATRLDLSSTASADEVVRLAGADTTVPGTRAYNPAFDVTPADLITAIVTEQQVWRP